VLDAHLGNVERVRSTVEQTLGTAERFDEPGGMIRSLATIGFLELSLDRPTEAHRHLERAGSIAASTGVREPWFQRFLVDDAEALAALGEPGEAERALQRFEAAAEGLDREWPRAVADRARGMILVSAGTPAEGIADLDRSREALEAAGLPFELGRTLLCLGVAQRRAKRRGGARASLERATATFDRLGARLWAERARAELARVGGRAPSRHDLTPTERRVAELVAKGRTNKEIAAGLFLSVKTVEASLTRTYAKLGVRSRTELARRILDADEGR
jgi:DNA-binding CsgD family transcriptional regulator